eukprot:CAMPEP_0113540184 /NCGR_PEP_ID=MMETSP0015_2-20120614/8340_1 /TAXON_ID=2838 /ORGANISM="Odontella" /LENGTH=53 /DNA_ID=CAMNT_0000439961 /DNA_START=87 /DNA_END=245 /DNA_ORIENTATION=- /assembly_acc=CAM_ASM_000160
MADTLMLRVSATIFALFALLLFAKAAVPEFNQVEIDVEADEVGFDDHKHLADW